MDQIVQAENSDEEYEKMAQEYESAKGVKLPPRHKGSAAKGGRGFARPAIQEAPAQAKIENPETPQIAEKSDVKKGSIKALEA